MRSCSPAQRSRPLHAQGPGGVAHLQDEPSARRRRHGDETVALVEALSLAVDRIDDDEATAHVHHAGQGRCERVSEKGRSQALTV